MAPRILAFSGSLRRASWNHHLVAVAAAGAAAAGADVQLIRLVDYPLPVFNEDLEADSGLPEAATRLKDLFRQHHGLLIAIPEYNSSISAALKNAIDWISRPDEGFPPLDCFSGKVAGIMATSPGALGGIRGLPTTRLILSSIGVTVHPGQIALPHCEKAFDDDGSMRDPAMKDLVENIGRSVAELAAGRAGDRT